MDGARVLVGTDDGLRLVGSDGTIGMGGQGVDHALTTAGDVWAIADGRAVWHLPPRGDPDLLTEADAEPLNCLLLAGDRLLAGGGGAALYEVDPSLRRVASFDQAAGRETWYTPWGGPPDVRSMAQGVDGTLYVNVHVGGVVRSTDGGGTWSATIDIHADVHQVIVDPARPGRAYAATARGLAETSDGGDTWAFSAEGLHAAYCRAVAVSADWLYLSASQGPAGHRAALYRRRIDGGRYERCATGLPGFLSTNLDTFCLDAREALVVAGDAAGTVYASADHGATWEVAAEGLPGIRCIAIG